MINKELEDLFNVLEEELNNETSNHKKLILLRNYCIFRLMYYSALKKEDIINLRIDCLDEDICKLSYNGNDMKIVDKKLVNLLRDHMYINKPEEFLFENINKGCSHKLTSKTVEHIIGQVFTKIGEANRSSLYLSEIRLRGLREDKKFTDKEILYWLGYRNVTTSTVNENILYSKILEN